MELQKQHSVQLKVMNDEVCIYTLNIIKNNLINAVQILSLQRQLEELKRLHLQDIGKFVLAVFFCSCV